MVKLKRLKIHRYRNVEPCELIFSDRRNVLLGPNGAGKTTLLSLISKVLRTNLTDASDPFSIELTFPQGSLTGKIASREPRIDRAELLNLPSMARAAREGAYAAPEVPDLKLTLMRTDRQETTSFYRSGDKFAIRETDLRRESPSDILTIPASLLSETLALATTWPKNNNQITIDRVLRREIPPPRRGDATPQPLAPRRPCRDPASLTRPA